MKIKAKQNAKGQQNTKMKKILLYAAIAASAFSCQDVLDDMDLGEAPNLLVVEGTFTDIPSEHTIKLSWTGSYFNKAPFNTAAGASLSIYDNETGTLICALSEKEPGLYVTPANASGVIGRNYRLEIELGGQMYHAIDYLAPGGKLDSAEIGPNDWDKTLNSIYLYGYNPQDQENYYFWMLYFNGVPYEDYSVLPFTDHLFLSDTIKRVEIYGDSRFADRMFITNIGDTVNVKVQQYGLSQSAFKFHTGLRSILTKGGMFDSPMVQVPTNIYKLGPDGKPAEYQAGFFKTSTLQEYQLSFFSEKSPGLLRQTNN
jgi:hypothetical protein